MEILQTAVLSLLLSFTLGAISGIIWRTFLKGIK